MNQCKLRFSKQRGEGRKTWSPQGTLFKTSIKSERPLCSTSKLISDAENNDRRIHTCLRKGTLQVMTSHKQETFWICKWGAKTTKRILCRWRGGGYHGTYWPVCFNPSDSTNALLQENDLDYYRCCLGSHCSQAIGKLKVKLKSRVSSILEVDSDDELGSLWVLWWAQPHSRQAAVLGPHEWNLKNTMTMVVEVVWSSQLNNY